MYTTETSAGSDNIAAQRQISPYTNRYPVQGLNFEGGILKKQQTSFLTRLVLPNLARMLNGQHQTTFLTQEYHRSDLKSLDRGRNCGCLGGPESRISAPRALSAPRYVLPQRAKTRVQIFANIQNCVRTACTAFPKMKTASA